MTQTHLLNSLKLPVKKRASILHGEHTNMDTVVYWEIFESTGSIEAYLAYCKNEEVSSDSLMESEELENKSIEGDK